MKKGGAAKGELVLAMYELANCFRNVSTKVPWSVRYDNGCVTDWTPEI